MKREQDILNDEIMKFIKPKFRYNRKLKDLMTAYSILMMIVTKDNYKKEKSYDYVEHIMKKYKLKDKGRK